MKARGETDELMRMEIMRFKEYSAGPESDKLHISQPASWKALEESPSLLLYETGTRGPHANVVRYGSVKGIRVNPRFIFFRFDEKGRFSRAILNEFADRLGLSRFELNRTHWAIKEGGIPSALIAKVVPSYDVVFSFAGEDRVYVEKVARYLKARGVTIFYDLFELTDLWGKDLAEHFDAIYRQSGRYCVIFISSNYVRKMWTRHERRTALERALQEQGDYILPARFDDTPVDGIRSTLGYISLAHLKPFELGRHILRKLGREGK